MRVVTILRQGNLRDAPANAAAIEQAGYDGAVTMENQHEPFLPLAAAAAADKARAAGEGGAAETSHALFALAVGARIPLTAALVADACSGKHLFRKVHYEMVGETTAETRGLFESPSTRAQGSSEAQEAQEAANAKPMDVDGVGAEVMET